VKILLDLEKNWKQIIPMLGAWSRITFNDPGMHGVDWDGMP